jgi:hypothetical protein
VDLDIEEVNHEETIEGEPNARNNTESESQKIKAPKRGSPKKHK